MDCSPPGSTVHGILQPRILEWVAIPFSRGSSQSRDWTQVPYNEGKFFTTEPPRKPYNKSSLYGPILTKTMKQLPKSSSFCSFFTVLKQPSENCPWHHDIGIHTYLGMFAHHRCMITKGLLSNLKCLALCWGSCWVRAALTRRRQVVAGETILRASTQYPAASWWLGDLPGGWWALWGAALRASRCAYSQVAQKTVLWKGGVIILVLGWAQWQGASSLQAQVGWRKQRNWPTLGHGLSRWSLFSLKRRTLCFLHRKSFKTLASQTVEINLPLSKCYLKEHCTYPGDCVECSLNLFIYVWTGCTACGILIPEPGIEARPPEILTTGLPVFFICVICFICFKCFLEGRSLLTSCKSRPTGPACSPFLEPLLTWDLGAQ